jgi:hypothetical protein
VTGVVVGRSVCVGFGSDWSEEPTFQDVESATLEFESFLSVLPDPLLAGREVESELAPDRVADAPLQCAERFFGGLAFGEFALVVDASGGVVTNLGHGDEMHGVVEFAVASWVVPVSFAWSAGRLDGSGAVVGSEPFRGREAGRVGDVAEDVGGDDGSDTVQLEQGGLGVPDSIADA